MSKMWFYILTIIWLLWLNCFKYASVVTATNLTTDQTVLLAVKSHILDPQNILTSNWSNSVLACHWVGVSCGVRHERVTALDLSNMGLGGTIPPQLGNLSFLVSLNFSYNNFHGHLPKELGQLHRMKIVSLSNNYLNGDIPSWFGYFPKLEYLNLGINNFTGTIPTTLFSLLSSNSSVNGGNIVSKLKVFSVEYNQIYGPIPSSIFNVSSLQQISFAFNSLFDTLPDDICNSFTKLEFLSFMSNNLYGQLPSNLGKCSDLQVLSLSINKFAGRIPTSIGNLTKLTELYLGFTNISGSIPGEIGNLRKLEYLSLADSKLTGSLPSRILNISTMILLDVASNFLSGDVPSNTVVGTPNLKELYLWGNNLSGTIPRFISNASNLVILDLGTNSFSGPVPESLGNLRFLEILSIEVNNLTSELLKSGECSFVSYLGNCTYLTDLTMSSNKFMNCMLPTSFNNLFQSLEIFEASTCAIRGNIPRDIGNLSNLIEINLDRNELRGPLPETIGSLQKLQRLIVSENKLQGEIPHELCHLKKMETLALFSNNFYGALPTCFSNFTSLRAIFLDDNKFSSTIPSTFWSLTYLLVVGLSMNNFSGSIPFDIGSMKVLTRIYLSSNQLSGSLPSSIGDLKDLSYLSLADNDFQGHIPQSFGSLVNIETLDLSHNHLSGVIPKSLESLRYLKQLNVSFNALEGEIPTGGEFKNFSARSFMGNYDLCGPPRLRVSPCKVQTTTKLKKSSSLDKLRYILPSISAAVLMLVIIIIIFIKRNKQKIDVHNQESLVALASWRRFSYLDLQRATNDFSESNLLGFGAFGSVYKGELSDGAPIAVKVFKTESDEEVSRSFDVECEVLRNIRHRNLVKIISGCYNLDFKALVLKYMVNGSLEKWLFSHNHFLDILQRLAIMIDVAAALEYLHHGLSTPLVHCDLKPSNVLLDEEMVAHVSDFGMSKILGEGKSVTETMTLATIGYMAPEYGSLGIVSTKGDVYSYGILLMETFTRKKPTDETFSAEMSLKQWVNDSLSRSVFEIVDDNLLKTEERNSTAKAECVSSVFQLALDCSAESSVGRTSMEDVLVTLKKIKQKFEKDMNRRY